MRRLPLVLALLLLAPAVSAQVYKWTDAHGTVHYSESPPPQGTNYTRITTAGSEQPATAPPAARQPEKPAEALTTAPVEDTPENRAKLCSSLKANLDLLKGNGPVVMEQNGKQVALDQTQRGQQTADAEKQYSQFCAR